MSINRGMDKGDVVCVCVYIYIYIYIYTHTHTTECYLAIKKNEIMPFEATWKNIEIIIPSEVSQTKTNII